jgi:hypothetical protein
VDRVFLKRTKPNARNTTSYIRKIPKHQSNKEKYQNIRATNKLQHMDISSLHFQRELSKSIS